MSFRPKVLFSPLPTDLRPFSIRFTVNSFGLPSFSAALVFSQRLDKPLFDLRSMHSEPPWHSYQITKYLIATKYFWVYISKTGSFNKETWLDFQIRIWLGGETSEEVCIIMVSMPCTRLFPCSIFSFLFNNKQLLSAPLERSQISEFIRDFG